MNTVLHHYLEQFTTWETKLPGHASPLLRAARQEAMTRLMETGFPRERMENWKYTSVKSLVEKAFRVPVPGCMGLDPADLDPFLLDRRRANHLVFINGFVSPPLSDLQGLPAGVRVESLARVANHADNRLYPCLEGGPMGADQGFADMNRALWWDGALVHLLPGARLIKPLQLLFLTTPSREPPVTLPWNVVIAGRESEGVIIERYVTLGESAHFTDTRTTLLLDEGARVRHVLLLDESRQAYHVGVLQASQAAGSRLDSHVFAAGGQLTRRDAHLHLNGEEAECSLDGLFMAGGRQHMDFHTWIHHDRSETRSRQLYKGVADGRARGVFNGVVEVLPGVHRTQSHQVTANLLLSDTAEIDTKPQLEINTDDVQCSHGASVGSLDEEALFYLQSRGLDAASARLLLIRGFIDELLQRVEPPLVREWLGRSLDGGGMLP